MSSLTAFSGWKLYDAGELSTIRTCFKSLPSLLRSWKTNSKPFHIVSQQMKLTHVASASKQRYLCRIFRKIACKHPKPSDLKNSIISSFSWRLMYRAALGRAVVWWPCTRHFSTAVLLSTQEYQLLPANEMLTSATLPLTRITTRVKFKHW